MPYKKQPKSYLKRRASGASPPRKKNRKTFFTKNFSDKITPIKPRSKNFLDKITPIKPRSKNFLDKITPIKLRSPSCSRSLRSHHLRLWRHPHGERQHCVFCEKN